MAATHNSSVTTIENGKELSGNESSLLSAESGMRSIEPAGLLGLYEQMLTIRFFEEEVQRLFARDLVRGSTHLGIGQEAVAVGTCAAMRPGDTATATYRGHAVTLAMGASAERAFAEILGRSTGLCKGKGGSMHLTDISKGFLGSFAIVGANLPISVGAAWAAKCSGSGAVALAFFGDGSTNIGAFHEAMNLASIWKLPVIFVCENNLYGEYSPIATTTPVKNLTDRAVSYAMKSTQIDGNDVEIVQEAVNLAIERAVAGGGPTFIEAMTYRQSGHSRTDPGAYRPKGELESWIARDPIAATGRRLIALGFTDQELLDTQVTMAAEVALASTRAQAATAPELNELESEVWAAS